MLLDDETLISGDGVALNPIANRLGRGTTLNSDGDEHTLKRSVLAHRLTPKAVRKMTSTIEQRAEQIVENALLKQRVDGVEDISAALPVSIVLNPLSFGELRIGPAKRA